MALPTLPTAENELGSVTNLVDLNEADDINQLRRLAEALALRDHWNPTQPSDAYHTIETASWAESGTGTPTLNSVRRIMSPGIANTSGRDNYAIVEGYNVQQGGEVVIDSAEAAWADRFETRWVTPGGDDWFEWMKSFAPIGGAFRRPFYIVADRVDGNVQWGGQTSRVTFQTDNVGHASAAAWFTAECTNPSTLASTLTVPNGTLYFATKDVSIITAFDGTAARNVLWMDDSIFKFGTSSGQNQCHGTLVLWTPSVSTTLLDLLCNNATRKFVISGTGAGLLETDITVANGVKWGIAASQKQAWWGATPVAQPDFIASPTGGSVQDVECRAAVDEIRELLMDVGLKAST